MEASYTLVEANRLLPLVTAIAGELTERRDEQRKLQRLHLELEQARTNEGVCIALYDLDSRLFEIELGLKQVRKEFALLGLHILRVSPLTIHIPGNTQQGQLVFCWQEGETRVCHGHALGEEENPRRPLRVRASSPGQA